MNQATAIQLAPKPPGLVERTAQRVGVDPDKLLVTLKATAFRSDKGVTNEQMLALLAVAERHRLDPFTKEIYAYPDKGGGIVPVVGIDGWIRIANEHPQFDGWEFAYDPKEQAATCIIFRKDRAHPTSVTEYVSECRRETDPWKKSPRRMIRNRSIAQCVRLAFGFAGIHDDDEAQAIVESEPKPTAASRVRAALRPQTMASDVIDMESGEVPAPLSAFDSIDTRTLADFIETLKSCTSNEGAEMLLDEARAALSESEFDTLVGAYRVTFNQQENQE